MIHAQTDFRSQLLLLIGMVVGGGYLFVTIWALAKWPYDVAGALLICAGLVALSIPLLAKAQRAEPDPWVRRLFPIGLLTMLLAGLGQVFVVYAYYNGVADVESYYSTWGQALASQFWEGDLVPRLPVPLIGIGFIIVLTGIIYALIGPTVVGAFILYSWLAFWGLYFCYRAFRTAMPGADYRRYAVLVFFLPSLVFWSSGIGKGAWMTLCIGLTLLGVARLITRTPRAALPLLAGLGGTALVRPHITALLVVGLVAGALVRRTVKSNPLARTATFAFIAVLGVIAFLGAASFLKLDTLSLDSVTQRLDENARKTSDWGNSTFTPVVVHSPLNLPWATITVLFRPFPWEAPNLVALASSLESLALIGFIALSWRRWRQIPRLLRTYPYLMTALVIILLFIIAFSTIGNFGLLVRERIMIIPLGMIFLCLASETSDTTSDVNLAKYGDE